MRKAMMIIRYVSTEFLYRNELGIKTLVDFYASRCGCWYIDKLKPAYPKFESLELGSNVRKVMKSIVVETQRKYPMAHPRLLRNRQLLV
jgi:hypothetical protein